MITVVIGDIGGHATVLERILDDLGIGKDNKVPEHIRVVNVGDLVRADDRYRDSNEEIVRRVSKIIDSNPPGRWVQLIGNHECAALAGIVKSNWKAEHAFTADCLEILERMWRSKTMVLAAHHGDTLITHAGLTRDYWAELGSPSTAGDAAKLINQAAGSPIESFARPGRMVTQELTTNADTMWAEVNMELLLPWMQSSDMPFDQIHGHASPFHWPNEEYWEETPQVIRNATVADQAFRRSVTTTPNGKTFTSVDWTLENTSPDHLWPLLRLGDPIVSGTVALNPELWRDPGLLFSLSKSDGTSYSVIGGARARVAMWENRIAGGHDTFLPSVHRIARGNEELLQGFLRDGDFSGQEFSFELDISWNRSGGYDAVKLLLEEFLPARLRNLVKSLPPLDGAAVNENRTVGVPEEFSDLNVTVLDLPINALPSSRQRQRPLVLGTRWVRLILLTNGLIALWHPCELKSWPDDKVPWPHNAVPSRSRDNLISLVSGHLSAKDRQERWVQDTVAHEKYFAESWSGELEFWQDSAFEWLTKSLTLDDVQALRDELGLLSHYVPSVRWTQRAMKRRSKEEGVNDSYSHVAKELKDCEAALSIMLADMRSKLTESFDVLATVSQRVQEDAASKAQETSERLNWLITLFTAILFVPTVVSGIYGANIDSLSPGSLGTMHELLGWMAGSALVSFGLLNLITKKLGLSVLGIVTGVAIVIGTVWSNFNGGKELGVLFNFFFFAVFLVGAVLLNRVGSKKEAHE